MSVDKHLNLYVPVTFLFHELYKIGTFWEFVSKFK